MNGLCVIGAVVLFALTAQCISGKHLLLAFLLVIGACEMTFHAAGMVGNHYTKERIEIIRRDAVDEYKKGLHHDHHDPSRVKEVQDAE